MLLVFNPFHNIFKSIFDYFCRFAVKNQVMIIFAGTQGYTDKIPLEQMRAWETSMLRFMESSYPDIGKDIAEKKRITDETTEKLRSALDAFNSTWK